METKDNAQRSYLISIVEAFFRVRSFLDYIWNSATLIWIEAKQFETTLRWNCIEVEVDKFTALCEGIFENAFIHMKPIIWPIPPWETSFCTFFPQVIALTL